MENLGAGFFLDQPIAGLPGQDNFVFLFPHTEFNCINIISGTVIDLERIMSEWQIVPAGKHFIIAFFIYGSRINTFQHAFFV
jgi:hypothetical protein